jgi:hypothetical protein
MMVIRRAAEVGMDGDNIPPEAAIGLDVTEEERQMLLLALAHTSLERPGWTDALRRLARKFDTPRPGAPPPREGDHYTPMFKAFRETGNNAIVRAKSALAAAMATIPRCAECKLPADHTCFDAAGDAFATCALHVRAGGIDGDEAPVERKWVGDLFTASKALENVHLG